MMSFISIVFKEKSSAVVALNFGSIITGQVQSVFNSGKKLLEHVIA
jgi:hypothetical protein